MQIAVRVDVSELPAPPTRPLRNRFTLMTCVNFLSLIENRHTLSRKPLFLWFMRDKVATYCAPTIRLSIIAWTGFARALLWLFWHMTCHDLWHVMSWYNRTEKSWQDSTCHVLVSLWDDRPCHVITWHNPTHDTSLHVLMWHDRLRFGMHVYV